jgi:hypothetical protein
MHTLENCSQKKAPVAEKWVLIFCTMSEKNRYDALVNAEVECLPGSYHN